MNINVLESIVKKSIGQEVYCLFVKKFSKAKNRADEYVFLFKETRKLAAKMTFQNGHYEAKLQNGAMISGYADELVGA